VIVGQVVTFDKMEPGRRGGGKHWTKEEIAARQAAEQGVVSKKKKPPKMPDWLDDEAKAVWKKTLKEMKEFNILETIDADCLATYCNAVAQYKETSLLVQEHGYTIYNAAGSKVVSPHVIAQQGYSRTMIQYADKLGLNASARARLSKKKADKQVDPNADLFD
jgi:P27 family predicted phage terminase small subunit